MKKKLMVLFAFWVWRKAFGEDFFDDFPEIKIKVVKKLEKMLIQKK